MCQDYTNLNKACPNDSFSLPRIDQLVDATIGHELLSFMDAYSGYNQIFMHPADREHTTFITDRGLYCYNTMPESNSYPTAQELILIYVNICSCMFIPQLPNLIQERQKHSSIPCLHGGLHTSEIIFASRISPKIAYAATVHLLEISHHELSFALKNSSIPPIVSSTHL
ncbi:unnamed protein product [Prunus armeniaca]